MQLSSQWLLKEHLFLLLFGQVLQASDIFLLFLIECRCIFGVRSRGLLLNNFILLSLISPILQNRGFLHVCVRGVINFYFRNIRNTLSFYVFVWATWLILHRYGDFKLLIAVGFLLCFWSSFNNNGLLLFGWLWRVLLSYDGIIDCLNCWDCLWDDFSIIILRPNSHNAEDYDAHF